MARRNRTIRKRRFYWYKNDPSISSARGYHPCYVYDKNEAKNEYKIFCFTHKAKKGERTKLNYNINLKQNCYVLNSSKTIGREEFGDQIVGFKISQNKKDKKVLSRIKKRSN